jgi:hypothetical protein
MAKQIARLLKTDIMADLDLPGLAQLLESKGRKGDTMLAHITPQEAALLKARGGAGTMNPDTGLPEFYDGDSDFSLMKYAGDPDYTTGTYRAAPQLPYSAAETDYGFNRIESPDYASPTTFEYTSPRYTGGAQTLSDLQQKAAQQYAGSKFPYPAVSPQDVYEGAPYPAQFEFPSGMSARRSLIGATGEPSTYFTPTGYVNPFQYEMERSDYSPPPSDLVTKPPGFLDRIGQRLQQPETLEKLGLAGLQALPGILASRQAAQQGREARAEMQRLAAPYQQQGQALLQQAQRGELTAPGQQQIQAMQARAAQGVAARGGVGAEQAAAQVEAFRQQLLQGQYEMGLKVANIGDQIAAGAIRTGLSADQYVNELTNNYFTNIARMSYGQAPQIAQPQTQVVR